MAPVMVVVATTPDEVVEVRARLVELGVPTADVVAVRAVMGPPEQRCWVERQQVAAPSAPNVPGAIVGGVLGGVLGHRIGSGRGNDVATAIGAVGGAAIGANVNRGSQT